MNKHLVPIVRHGAKRRIRLDMTFKDFLVFVGLCAFSVLMLYLYSVAMEAFA